VLSCDEDMVAAAVRKEKMNRIEVRSSWMRRI
jgi:hypothetical protein